MIAAVRGLLVSTPGTSAPAHEHQAADNSVMIHHLLLHLADCCATCRLYRLQDAVRH
jgi:hypothetical protein